MFGLIIYFVLVSMPTLQYYSQNSECYFECMNKEDGFHLQGDLSGFVIWMFYFLNLRTENVITVQELVLRRLFHICTLRKCGVVLF